MWWGRVTVRLRCWMWLFYCRTSMPTYQVRCCIVCKSVRITHMSAGTTRAHCSPLWSGQLLHLPKLWYTRYFCHLRSFRSSIRTMAVQSMAVPWSEQTSSKSHVRLSASDFFMSSNHVRIFIVLKKQLHTGWAKTKLADYGTVIWGWTLWLYSDQTLESLGSWWTIFPKYSY